MMVIYLKEPVIFLVLFMTPMPTPLHLSTTLNFLSSIFFLSQSFIPFGSSSPHTLFTLAIGGRLWLKVRDIYVVLAKEDKVEGVILFLRSKHLRNPLYLCIIIRRPGYPLPKIVLKCL